MKASVAIQVLPGVTEKDKICEVVDKCIEYIKAQGLKTFVSPFETTIEGELDQLIDIVKQSGAELAGSGIVIEKGFQVGGKTIRDMGVKLESLAIVDSMDNGTITFRD